MAEERKIAVIIVHHSRKAGSEGDVFDEVAVIEGLTGSVDATIILKRDREQDSGTLNATGRDIEECEKAMMFNKQLCKWSILGDVVEHQSTKMGNSILDVLKSATKPLHSSEIVELTNGTKSYVAKTLSIMLKNEVIQKTDKGMYQIFQVKEGVQQCELPTT
jgi:hypothetical protein